MKKWRLVKNDARHWHYERRRVSERLERLEHYDFQITLVANPLNWSVKRLTDYSGVKELSFGPLRLMMYYG